MFVGLVEDTFRGVVCVSAVKHPPLSLSPFFSLSLPPPPTLPYIHWGGGGCFLFRNQSPPGFFLFLSGDQFVHTIATL